METVRNFLLEEPLSEKDAILKMAAFCLPVAFGLLLLLGPIFFWLWPAGFELPAEARAPAGGQMESECDQLLERVHEATQSAHKAQSMEQALQQEKEEEEAGKAARKKQADGIKAELKMMVGLMQGASACVEQTEGVCDMLLERMFELEQVEAKLREDLAAAEGRSAAAAAQIVSVRQACTVLVAKIGGHKAAANEAMQLGAGLMAAVHGDELAVDLIVAQGKEAQRRLEVAKAAEALYDLAGAAM